MINQAQLREFEALVAQTESNEVAFRTSIQAQDLDDAAKRLAELYGRERVLSVWNEDDASTPRSEVGELQLRIQHEL